MSQCKDLESSLTIYKKKSISLKISLWIPVSRRLKQEAIEFKTSFSCVADAVSKQPKKVCYVYDF
jgi:hypothetical protein